MKSLRILLTFFFIAFAISLYAVEKENHLNADYTIEKNEIIKDQSSNLANFQNQENLVTTESSKNLISLKRFFAEKYTKITGEDESSFKFGPFLLGFLLGLIGVLIVYLVNIDAPDRKVKTKSAWIGLGTWIVLLVLLSL